jgi:phage tail sheath protein FI
MTITPTYPGVYLREEQGGVRPLTGVATSITAFVGRALRGPINEPITCNGFGDYEREFGGLWTESSMSYAVRDFFLNGGSIAVIVRLFNPLFPTETQRAAAEASAKIDGGGQADAIIGLINTNKAKTASEIVTAVNNAVGLIAPSKAAETAAGVVMLQATRDAAARPPSFGDLTKAAEDAANNLVVGDGKTAAQALVTKLKQFPASTLNPVLIAQANSELAAEQDLVKKAGLQIVVDALVLRQGQPPSGDTIMALVAPAKAAAQTAAGDAVAPRTRAILDLVGLRLEAATPGAWGNALRARISTDVPGGNEKAFNLTILDGITGRSEEYLNVSTDPISTRYVEKTLKSQSVLVRAAAVPAKPTANAAPPMPRNAFDSAYSTGVLEGERGSDGLKLKQSNYTGNEGDKEGIYALEKTDLFNLLCLPPYAADLDLESPILDEAIAYCERKRAFLLLDPPQDWKSKKDAKSKFAALAIAKSDHAAMFFPRLRQPDPLRDNRVGSFAPCGAVAGLFARTDANRGVWKAPAGLDATLNGVPELEVSLTDPENGELNPLGLNCLRVKPGAGRVVWGARTLRGDDRLASEYKYIPVRRLALMIEESLYRGMQWVVFEPNDEPLWAQIRMNVTSFMHGLFRQGAFAGASPKEAYLVKCDKETTPQADVNLGIVNMIVGFAPLKPAEFVFIKLQQIAGQQS